MQEQIKPTEVELFFLMDLIEYFQGKNSKKESYKKIIKTVSE